jgi:hypothetical protein
MVLLHTPIYLELQNYPHPLIPIAFTTNSPAALRSGAVGNMVSIIAIVLLALPLYFVYSCYSSLQKNISEAKLSGLPYVITRE